MRAAGAAWPWLAAPALVWWRARGSRTLDEEPGTAGADAPLVSVIVPARNEAPNIARCVRSVLDTTYARLELVVVDDQSTDDTAALARAAIGGEPRGRVIATPPLPAGWFGKPWACTTGAEAARGEILLFADADTTHAPDLVTRAVHALRRRGGGLLSVVGRQELGTFWERLVQPQVLAVLLGRYGGTERVNRSRRVVDKIANGQCLLVDRATYDATGGHGAVRGAVAEDLRLAQHVFARGFPVHLVLGERQLATRMYTSLGELVRGWRKNVYAGGRDAMPLGRVGRAVFPLLLLLPPLMSLAPAVALLLIPMAGIPPDVARAAIVAQAASLAFWLGAYRRGGVPAAYALLAPVGAAVLLAIVVQAIARGRRVEWRGREYVSA
ncbi:glycosyl transferase family 2 [Gemmatirosa kalamazoonensis]|uniref:Glycosyl transferase family 2 n=1 Tax=Gemmatirosa kalamazoonensis TaxID=861299 RepID=W0RQS2_9BACT|nr:glycosyltransferase family 2 protein [Gemmatirosa kalamazoonensis]AHG91908.1 glycosyl transferase family 2 [Gemmatirosa kalamazoonensis]